MMHYLLWYSDLYNIFGRRKGLGKHIVIQMIGQDQSGGTDSSQRSMAD